MNSFFIVIVTFLFSVTSYAENAADCYKSSFDYIFSDLNSKSQRTAQLSKSKVNRIITLRNQARDLAKEANELDISEEERLNPNTPDGLRLASLNAQITAICVQIEEIAN